MKSKEIEIKEIEILTYSLRQINDVWRRYSICDGSALWNYDFIKRMKQGSWKAENEIRFLYANYPLEKLSTILVDLCFEIDENIRIYQKNEKDYNEYDYSKASKPEWKQNLYKLIYEHSVWMKNEMIEKYFQKKQGKPEGLDNDRLAEKSRTKELIENKIKIMDKSGWGYAFISENDYITFVNLLTNYFEYKSYTLPRSIIKLKRNCKTKFAQVLNEMHKNLSEKSLKSDHGFIKIIKILNHFKHCSDSEIYQAITR